MQTYEYEINNQTVNDFFNFHLKVLKRVLNGIPYEQIAQEFAPEFETYKYSKFTKSLSLLSFNKKGQLRGAYPVSPKETGIKMSVEGISTGFGNAMCAIDALGTPYLFNNSKTVIRALDAVTKKSLEIIIDPDNPEALSAYTDIVVTIPKVLKGKNGKAIDSAVDVCPHIGFIKDKSTLPEKYKETVSIIPFEQALAHGKNIFEFNNFKNGLKASLIIISVLLNHGSMSGSEIVDLYLKNSPNSALKSYPQDVIEREILKILERKGGLIQKVSQSESNQISYEVSPFGKDLVKAFLA